MIFKHSSWPRPIKIWPYWNIRFNCCFLSRAMVTFILFTSFAIIILGIIAIIRKQDKRQSIGTLVLGIILLSFSFPYIDAQGVEQAKIRAARTGRTKTNRRREKR